MHTSRSAIRLNINWPKDDVAAKGVTVRVSKFVNRCIVLRLRLAAQWLMSTRRGQLLLLLLLLALLAFGVLTRLASDVLRGTAQYQVDNDRYAVYIDGGSSGTRVRVFRYRPAHWPAYVSLVLPEPSMAVEPGLSAYATQPDGAADSLRPLLDFAYEHVPAQLWSTTPVKLLGTAGLRLLGEQQQADILAACGALLGGSRFTFEPGWATVIGGEMEGLYGWAAVNYITGALQEASRHAHHSRKEVLDPSQVFTGLLEMGGASMQVTFLPPPAAKLPSKYGSHLHLPGVPSRLFTHSYLGLGMDSALARAVEHVLQQQPRASSVADPCLPIGYVSDDGRHGNASFSQCLAVVQQILPDHNCSAASPLSSVALALTGMPAPPPVPSKRRRATSSSTSTAASVHAPGDAGADSSSPDGSAPGASAAASTGSGGGGGGGGGCTLQGVYVPALSGPFVAVENFAWTARALGLPVGATLRELREHGVRYCARHWSSLHAEFSGHIPDQFLVRYCFGAAYILALLHGGLGMGLDDARLTWTNSMRQAGSGPEVGINWVLGAAVADAMSGGGGGGGGDGSGGSGAGGGGSQRFWQLDARSMSGAGVRTALVLPLLAVLALVLAILAMLLGGLRSVGKAPKAAATPYGPGVGAGGLGGGEPPGRRPAGGATGAMGSAATAWSSSALSAVGVAAAGSSVSRGVQPEADASALDPGLGPSPGSGGSMAAGGRAVGSPFVGTRGNSPPRQDGGGSVGLKYSSLYKVHSAAMRRAPSFVSVFMGSDGGAGQ